MTQKEALKQIEKYCDANQMHLIRGSLSRMTYALSTPDRKNAVGNRVIDYDGKYYIRLSRYYSPKELLIWIDGFHSGLQNSNLNNGNNE